MICLVGLMVFAVLGIFSATHRQLAKEALSCMKDKATRSPCSTGFDEKYKATTINFLMDYNMRLAGFVNRNFKLLNWIVLIVTLFLLVDLAVSVYNYYYFGTCNPVSDYGCSLDEGRRWLDVIL